MSKPRFLVATAVAALLSLAPAARAQQPAPAPPPAAAPSAAATLSASIRTRLEYWDWFDARGGDGEYAFAGVHARAGVTGRASRVTWMAEAELPALLGVPRDAVAPAPEGQLGMGGSYAAANDGQRNSVNLFLRQAWVRVGAAPRATGHALRLGRFEFVDGTETLPADPSLATLKRERVAHRMLGNFGFTHVMRTFDGAHYTFERAGANVTVVAARPTRGVFDVKGWGDLDVGIAYAALTTRLPWSARAGGEARLFALHYDDARRTVATDNRPLTARQADGDRVRVTTVGAHLLQLLPTGAGPVDLLLWGAAQGGKWQSLDHRGLALAAEAGLQPGGLPALRPWLRAGWYRSSGDDDAADDTHGTYFQILPTPRPYARFPFYNGMNIDDAFGSLVLRPGTRLTLRGEVHALRLSEPADLWYVGGGAFEPQTFGYAGRPSGGRAGLATVWDAGADLRLTPRVTASAYAAWASGGAVTRAIYPDGARASLMTVELEVRR